MLRQLIGFISLIKSVLFQKLLQGFKASFTAEYPKTERSSSANSIMCLAHLFASLNSETQCIIWQTIRVLLHSLDIPRNLTAFQERALHLLLQCQNLHSRSLKTPYRSNLLNLLMPSGSGVSCFPKHLFLVFIPFCNILMVGGRFAELCREKGQGSA